jgi:hypothetical protein
VVADLGVDQGESLKAREEGAGIVSRLEMRQCLVEGTEGPLGFELVEEKPALRQAQVGQLLVAPELLGDRRRPLEQSERLIQAPLVPPQRRPGAAQGDSRLQGQRLVLKLHGGLLQKILGHLRPPHPALDLGEEHRGGRPQLPASGRFLEPIQEKDAETCQVTRPPRIFVQLLPSRRDQDLGESQGLETALAADRRRPLARRQAEQLVEVAAVLLGFLPALCGLGKLDRPEQDSLARPCQSLDSRDQIAGVEPPLGRAQIDHQTREPSPATSAGEQVRQRPRRHGGQQSSHGFRVEVHSSSGFSVPPLRHGKTSQKAPISVIILQTRHSCLHQGKECGPRGPEADDRQGA